MPDLHLADLSDFQPQVNFADYAAGGRPGVFIKATEGTTFVASTFADYRAKAHGAGLVFVGLYHFAHAGDVQAQVRHFVSTIGTLASGEVAVLDAEEPGLSAAWCREWMSSVQRATGRTPMLYCSWSYWGTTLSSMADYPLWIAAYHNLGHDDPRSSVPGCRFWQYSDNTQVPGVGSCDDSVFNGTVEELAALSGATPAPAPTPPAPTEESEMAFAIVPIPTDGTPVIIPLPQIGSRFGVSMVSVTLQAGTNGATVRAVLGPDWHGLDPDHPEDLTVPPDGRRFEDVQSSTNVLQITDKSQNAADPVSVLIEAK